METLFDFSTNNCKYRTTLVNTELHINQINCSVAIMYFTDETGNKINIPNGIQVYTHNYQNPQQSIIRIFYVERTII